MIWSCCCVDVTKTFQSEPVPGMHSNPIVFKSSFSFLARLHFSAEELLLYPRRQRRRPCRRPRRRPRRRRRPHAKC